MTNFDGISYAKEMVVGSNLPESNDFSLTSANQISFTGQTGRVTVEQKS